MKKLAVILLILLLSAGSAEAISSDKKLSLLESAVAGDKNAQFELAEIYEEEALEKSEDMFTPDADLMQKAMKWYKQAAEQGYRPAQHALMKVYSNTYSDDGTPMMQEEWLHLVNKLAKEGDITAQIELAEYYYYSRYYEGTDVEQCVKQAIYWYNQVLQGTDPDQSIVYNLDNYGTKDISRYDIQNRLKELAEADPVTEEKVKATKALYNNAVESGSLKTVIDLGDKWAEGNGIDQNIEMARKSYEYAAEHLSAEAQAKLARLLYENAKGLEDYQYAYFWAQAALIGQDQTAPELIAEIGKFLPADHREGIAAEAVIYFSSKTYN